MIEIKQMLKDAAGKDWKAAIAFYRNEKDFAETINKIKDDENRKPNGKAYASIARRFNSEYDPGKYGKKWYCCDGYDDAADMLENGYNCDLKPIKAAYNLSSASDPAVKHTLNFAGSIPSISDYLAGRPRDMRRIETTSKKVVNVFADVSISSREKKNNIFEATKQIAAYIGGIEKAGYSVNLYVCHMITTEANKNNITCSIVKLKDAANKTNLARYMFPLVHPACSRVFFHLETSFNPVFSDSFIDYCIGYPIAHSYFAYSALKAILPDNSVILSTQAIINGQSIQYQIEQMKAATPWKRTSGARIPA